MVNLKTMNPQTKTLIILALVTLLFSSISLLLVPKSPKSYVPYVVESPSPTGVKGFYSLLENNTTAGQVMVWNNPVQNLSLTDSNHLMIMIEPYNTFSSSETNKWIEWMEAGNQVLLVAENPDAFFNLNVSWLTEESTEQISSITGLGELNGSYKGFVNSYVRLLPSPNDQVLLKDNHGALALSKSYGKGQLIALIAPDWFTNQSILNYNHLDMILSLMQLRDPETVWFNDYVHGYENGPTVFDLYPDWFIYLFLQAAVILLLWLWYKGKRFGPIETPRESVVRYGDERIRAVAAWYERGGFYKESLNIQGEFLLDTIKTKWGISSKSDSRELIDAAKLRLPAGNHSKWQQNWDDFQDILKKNKITHKDYLKWSKELEDMRKEVENK